MERIRQRGATVKYNVPDWMKKKLEEDLKKEEEEKKQ